MYLSSLHLGHALSGADSNALIVLWVWDIYTGATLRYKALNDTVTDEGVE